MAIPTTDQKCRSWAAAKELYEILEHAMDMQGLTEEEKEQRYEQAFRKFRKRIEVQ